MLRLLMIMILAAVVGCQGGAASPLRAHAGHADRLPLSAGVKPFATGRPDIVLLITGGTNGMLELCNCAGAMPAGLARRSGLVRSYRSAFDNTFLLDSGDAFSVDADDIRNKFVMKGYRQIGYDAVVLGDQEWAASPDCLEKFLRAGPGVYVSSISPLDESEALPVKPAARRQWGAFKLAVLSYIPRESFMFFPEDKLEELSFPPAGELARRVDRLKRQGFVVVVVAHGDDEVCEAAARTLQADIVVRGHTSRSSPHLTRIGGTAVVKVGGSEIVGVLGIKVSNGGQVTGLEYRLELVDKDWPADERLLQTYQAYAHVAMRKALDAKRTSGLDYVPSSQCGRCHLPQYRAWQDSPHAAAYESLVKAGRTGDPNCITCHTSGFNTTKGFHTIQETPELAGVNCQDCHRFSLSDHDAAGFEPRGPGRDVCTTCHTPVTNPGFRYKAKRSKIRCPHD